MLTRLSFVSVASTVALLALAACGEPPAPSNGTSSSPTESGEENQTADPASCTLDALSAKSVTPTFKVYDPEAGVSPPAMTGGKIDGKWKVDKATIYIPKELKEDALPATSTGTISAWAVFKKDTYRLVLDVNASIDSTAGKLPPQENKTSASGTFSIRENAIKFEKACEKVDTQEAEISFSEKGNRGTLVVKFKTIVGYSYLELEATKE